MRNAILFALFAAALAAYSRPAQAQTAVMADAVELARPSGPDTAFSAVIVQPILPVAGIIGYGFVSKRYAEAYAGPAFFLGPLKLGAGVGIEQASPWVRTGVIASFDLAPISLFGIAEIGGSGPWASLEAMYHANGIIGIGTQGMSDSGVGPRLEITPLGPSAMMQTSLLYGWWNASVTGLVGVRATLN